MKPYSDRIIFFDTEFTDLNAKTGELLSIGMIKYTGEKLYLELESSAEPHPWVIEHVLPYLNQPKVSREKAKELIREFVGPDQPYLVAYVNQFDAIYWYELFGSAQDHPAYWIPIDFASILFGLGLSPNSMGIHEFFSSLGINKADYQEHNALADAELLRDTYLKLLATNQT